MRISVLKPLFLACVLFGTQAFAGVPSSVQITAKQEQTVDLTFLHTDGLTFIPIDLSSNLIFLRVELKGKQVWALLDNGSEATIIDSSLANELGIALKDVGGTATTGFGRAKSSRADRAELLVPKQFRIAASFWSTDISAVSSAVGRDIGVILGADILDNVSYLIDLRQNRVLFAKGGSLNFDAPSLIDFPVSNGKIDGTVNGRNAKLRIDLGSTSALRLSQPNWPSFFPSSDLVNLGRSVDGAGLIGRNQGVRDITLEIAQIRSVVDVKMIKDLGQNADGYVGLPFFQGMVTLFDYPDNKIVVLSR